MIRSVQQPLKFCNVSKLNKLQTMFSDFRLFVQSIVDYIWENGYNNFNIKSNKLDCPTFLDSTFLKKFPWNYTERLKQVAGKQALALISSATEKRRKQLWQLRKLQQEGKSTKYLQRAIDLYPLVKPKASNIAIELDSRFIDFKFDDQKHFLVFVRIKSIQKGFEIKIPISHSRVFEKWNNKGKLKNFVRLSKNNIYLYFEIENPTKKTSGEVVGCDQGIIDIVTLSDNQKISKYQNRFTLSNVLEILSRKKKGSRAFHRTQEFRKNLINWSINQLNFDNIKELRLEKLYKLRFKQNKSRFLSHWAYTLINDKLTRVSEEKGFLIKEIPNEFRSQRCSQCGWVRKANRKGKTFNCDKCGYTHDADENAASNLLLDLYEIPYWVRLKKINIQGFYWKPEGLFSEGHERIVHDAQ